MKGQQDIDKLFKSKLEGINSEGSVDANWLGAEHMLNAHYRRIMIRRFFAIGLIFSLFTIMGVILYSYDNGLVSTNAGAVELQVISDQPLDHKAIRAEEAALNSSKSKDPSLPQIETISVVSTDNSTQKVDPIVTVESTEKSGLSEKKNSPISTASTLALKGLNNERSTSLNSTSVLATNEAKLTAPAIEGAKRSSPFNILETKAEKMLLMPVFEVGVFNTEASGVKLRKQGPYMPFKNELKKVEIILEAGGLISNVFQNTNSGNTSGIASGYYYGLAFKYHFHPNLYAVTGANIHSRNGLNSDFVAETTFSGTWIAEPIRLSYLDIPLKIGYSKRRHSLDFGMSFSPLISVEVTERLETTGGNSQETIVLEEKKTRQREGFAGFDVAGTASYQFQINQRLSGQMALRFGLFDLTDNAYFSTGIIDDRNHQLRIGLSYRMFQL